MLEGVAESLTTTSTFRSPLNRETMLPVLELRPGDGPVTTGP